MVPGRGSVRRRKVCVPKVGSFCSGSTGAWSPNMETQSRLISPHNGPIRDVSCPHSLENREVFSENYDKSSCLEYQGRYTVWIWVGVWVFLTAFPSKLTGALARLCLPPRIPFSQQRRLLNSPVTYLSLHLSDMESFPSSVFSRESLNICDYLRPSSLACSFPTQK